MANTTTQAPVAAGSTAENSSPDVTTSDDTQTNPSIETSSVEELLKALDATSPSFVDQVKRPNAKATDESPKGGKTALEDAAREALTESEEEEEQDDEDDEEDEDEDEEEEQPAGTTPPPPAAAPPAKNFRLHTKDPKLGAFIGALKQAQRVNPDVNPAEVARLVGYDMPGAHVSTPAVESNVQRESAPDPLQGLRDEITALEAAIDHAEDVDYDRAKARKLERERVDKVAALHKAEESLLAQAEADRDFDAGFKAARAATTKLAPEADTEGTIQYDLVVAEMARIKRTEPGLLDQPDYPITVLNRVAVRHPTLFPLVSKTAPVVAKLAAKAEKLAAKGQKTRAVGTVVPGSNAGVALDASNLKENIGKLSVEDLIAVADKSGQMIRQKG